MRFLIVQHDPTAQPRTDRSRLGVLAPVNLDGFYAKEADAMDVAQFMAGERPERETFVVSIVAKVAP